MKNTFAVDRTDFEVYLEGVKTPFNTISIREKAGGFPQGSLTLPFTQDMANILDHTIVQIFGPDPLNGDKVLIFEGQVRAISYSKQGGSRIVDLSLDHILSQWREIKVRPKDALIPPRYSNAEGASLDESVYVESNTPSNIPQLIKKSLQGAFETIGGKKLKKILQKVSLSSTSGLKDELIQLLDTPEVQKGDLSLVVDFFQTKFAQNDIFWGIKSSSYDVNSSVMVFPNPGKVDVFKNKLVSENIQAIAKDLGASLQRGDLKFIQALASFLQTVFYSFQIPAIPIAIPSIKKAGWTQEAFEIPLRAIFTPNVDNTPPPLCNVFFPNQYTSFNYSRSFKSEPTRTIGSFKIPLAGGLQGFKGVWPFNVYPKHAFNEEDAQNNLLNFTPEESYRGVTLQEENYSYMLGKPAQNELRKWAEGKIPGKEAEDQMTEGAKEGKNFKPMFKESLTQLTANNHIKAKLKNRQCTVNADWHPYRLIGFTALILDEEGPAVYGTLAGSSFSISADGSISSSYTLSSPRLVSKHLIIGDDIDEESSQANQIHPDSQEAIIDINPFLFSGELYSFFTIGKEIYPFIMRGIFNKESKLAKFIQEGNAFTSFADNAQKMVKGEGKDHSVLSWTKEEEIKTTDESKRPTAFLRSAIINLLENYKSFEDDPKVQARWTFKLNRRVLLLKDTYFTELGIDSVLGSDHPSYTFNSAKFLTQQGGVKEALDLVEDHQPKVKKSSTVRPVKDIKRDIKVNYEYLAEFIGTLIRSSQEQNQLRKRFNDDRYILFNKQITDIVDREVEKSFIYKKQIKTKLGSIIESERFMTPELKTLQENINEYYDRLEILVELKDEYNAALVKKYKETERVVKKYKPSPSLEIAYKKPYNLTRQLHVKEALKGIKSISPSKFNVNIVK